MEDDPAKDAPPHGPASVPRGDARGADADSVSTMRGRDGEESVPDAHALLERCRHIEERMIPVMQQSLDEIREQREEISALKTALGVDIFGEVPARDLPPEALEEIRRVVARHRNGGNRPRDGT